MAYTIIESRYAGIQTEATYFVPLGQTFEYWCMKVTNTSDRARKLSLFTYCEFANLWHTFQDLTNLQYSLFSTRATLEDGILGVTCNPNYDFDGKDLTGCNRTWMALAGAPLAGVETVRERFLGSYGGYAAPEVVAKGKCSNFLAEGDNVVGGQQADLDLAPGESREIIVLLGLGTVSSHGKKTVAEFGNSARCETEFQKLKTAWHAPLESLQIETPDADFDHMVNVWNAYNALITYAWSRSASPFSFRASRSNISRSMARRSAESAPSIEGGSSQMKRILCSWLSSREHGSCISRMRLGEIESIGERVCPLRLNSDGSPGSRCDTPPLGPPP
jgi:cellobiose phosphorylase